MPTPIRLAANLDLRAAAPLRDTLLDHAGQPVALDASQVGRLGALCLQVLLASARDWREQGVDFNIEAPSDAFIDTLKLFGAADALAPALAAGAPKGVH
jgi:chemotaxis protein CheX